MTNQILRNMASNYARMMFSIVSVLVLTPIILCRLGPDAYGIWVLTITVSGYFSLTDLGITSAAIKYISHYRAMQQWSELNKVISTSLACFLMLALLALIGGGLLSEIAPHIFHVPQQFIPTIRILMFIVGILAASGFATVIPVQCAIAAQRQDLLNAWMLAIQILTAGLTIAFVYLGGGVVSLGCIQIFSTICNGLIGFAITRKYFPEAKFQLRWHKEFGFLIASFAGFALLITVSNKIIYFGDTVIIGHFLTMAAIASYAISQKISELIRSIVHSASGVLGTFVCDLAAHGKTESLGIIWTEGSKWALAIALPICVLCVICGSDLITSWIGTCYPGAALVLTLLAIGNLLDAIQSSGFQIICNGDGIRPLAIALTLEAICNFCLSVVLIKPFGVVGVAIGTIIPLFLRACIFCPLFLSRLTGIGLYRYLNKSIIPGLCSAALSVGMIALYKYCGLHTGRMSLAGLGFVLLPCEIAGMYLFCFSREQKRLVRQKLLQLLSRESETNKTAIPSLLNDTSNY